MIHRGRGLHCRSFTLIEVLIAIALVTALLGSMFGFLFNLLRARDAASAISMKQRAANVLLERLEHDLMTCMVGDDTRGVGVQGDAVSLRLLTRGVQANAKPDGSGHGVMFADLQRVEFRFDESRRRLEAGRTSSLAKESGMQFEEVGEEIFRVRFRYYDGTAWTESYDSLASDRLPTAVEVSIWFDPWPGEDMPIESEDDEIRFNDELSTKERRTFDSEAGFDELEAARLSDLGLDDEPEPDRRRLILIPDAEGEDS